MVKSGLILGALALFVAAGATLISPLCAPCAAIFLGLGAGYLAGVFEKPLTSSATSRVGAIGGALGGVGAILGQIIGTVLNGFIVGPAGMEKIYQNLGLPGGPSSAQVYYGGLVGGAVCFSLLDVLLMAGFGALGGLLWWRMNGRNAAPPPPTPVR